MYKKTIVASLLLAVIGGGLVVGALVPPPGHTVVENADDFVLLDKYEFEKAAADHVCPVFNYELVTSDEFQVIIDDAWNNLDRDLREIDARGYADQRAYYVDREEELFAYVMYKVRSKFSLELKEPDTESWKPETLLPEA